MSWIDLIAEKRIREAIAAGMLDELPGQGEPLRLEDLSHVPRVLRPGYRVLKNAGYLPAEMEGRLAVRRIEDLLYHCFDEAERERLRRELAEARLRANPLMERHRARLEGRRG